MKEKEASEKMTLIVQEKTKAKEKQEQSEKLKVVIEAKTKQINEKRSSVEAELAEAEPALIAAKKNVENISGKELAVIKGYASPPEMVFFALKPIYYMITKTVIGKGQKEVTWPEIKKFMSGDFVKQVQELKADDIPANVKTFVLKEYLNTEKWVI